MTVETLSPLTNPQVNYRQAIMPNHQSGSFTGDDTDNHDFVFQGRGKSTVGVSIDNAPNQIVTWSLYGMHAANGTVGDAGTFLIDSGTVALADKGDEGFVGYNYPYYLLRLAYSVAPTDDPKKTTSVYVDVSN